MPPKFRVINSQQLSALPIPLALDTIFFVVRDNAVLDGWTTFPPTVDAVVDCMSKRKSIYDRSTGFAGVKLERRASCILPYGAQSIRHAPGPFMLRSVISLPAKSRFLSTIELYVPSETITWSCS